MLYLLLSFVLLHLTLISTKAVRICLHHPQGQSIKEYPFSIIVAAHNEEEHLRNLILHLGNQSYPEYEIILVLDRCTDQSRKIASDLNTKFSRLNVIEIDQKPSGVDGKKNALEIGILAAKHDWMLFTDADCVPVSRSWIQSFANEIDPATDILLGISKYQWMPGLLNALIQYETFQTALHFIGSAMSGKPYMALGRNVAYRKSLFLNSCGFSDTKHITGGDDDLFVQKNGNKRNTKVVLTPESLTNSVVKRKWKTYFVQKTRHLSVGKHYRLKLKIIHAFRAVVHLLVWMSFLYLAVNDSLGTITLGFFCSVIVIQGFIFTRTASKMGLPFSVLWFPITDLLYAVMLPAMGIRSAFVKRVKWK